eukprot:13797712-Alexandrium_andersonii.AAC.1
MCIRDRSRTPGGPCCGNPATSKAGCPGRATSGSRNSNAIQLASSCQAAAACYRSTVAAPRAVARPRVWVGGGCGGRVATRSCVSVTVLQGLEAAK